ncbi:hypothetical protein GQ457_02G029810 [Hibiscus cannabinus]
MMLEAFWSYNVELLFAASFDSKMRCLCSVFDVKKQGKPIREVQTKYWKLREGENRLSGLLEGISNDIERFLVSLVLVAAQNSAFLVSSIDTSSVVSVPNSNTGIQISVMLEGYRYPFEFTLVSIPGEGYRYPFVD